MIVIIIITIIISVQLSNFFGSGMIHLTEKSIFTTGLELHDKRVLWCPITHTLLFEILCYADKSSCGSNHLSVFHERDVRIPPLISEFIVFITNPKMGSLCNTRHLIILSIPGAC